MIKLDRYKILTHWKATPARAVQLQREIAKQVLVQSLVGTPATVAGVTVHVEEDWCRAAVAVLKYPELELVEWAVAEGDLTFPFLTGLVTFREGPIILRALDKLKKQPQVIIFNGPGIAHPRRVGVASHLGVLVGIPSIGCCETRLCGDYSDPGPDKGDKSPLVHRRETVGAVLRTSKEAPPLFVSPGHMVDMDDSVNIVLSCTKEERIPETWRLAQKMADGWLP